MSTQYKGIVGKRALIEWGIRGMLEVRVLEVSPSGERVKIQGPNHIEWKRCDEHEIIEILEDSP